MRQGLVALIGAWLLVGGCGSGSNPRSDVPDARSDGGTSGAEDTGKDAASDGMTTDLGTATDSNPATNACPGGLVGPGVVRIVKSGDAFSLTRDGAPYYIKGFCGQAFLNTAQRSGANSTRTYRSDGIGPILEDAKNRCMTVLLGIELSQKPEDYTNTTYLDSKRAEVTRLLGSVKDHPALLMWGLGNEINHGADTQAAWTFVSELAQMIHTSDPNHPVITVLAGANVTSINNIVKWTNGIDAIGINSYDAVVNALSDVGKSNFQGPIIISEWGPTGHWEAPKTPWRGRALER
ncbi:MAG TPA: glycoside hydrolase family 2 TIM barrel-domain containing protein [Polyangia bacterium]